MSILIEILMNQVEASLRHLLYVLKDVTEEMSNIIPEGFNNSIKWNVGHIFLDQYLWIYLKIDDELEVPEHFREWFGYGTKPVE
jgi:hypothetical protein